MQQKRKIVSWISLAILSILLVFGQIMPFIESSHVAAQPVDGQDGVAAIYNNPSAVCMATINHAASHKDFILGGGTGPYGDTDMFHKTLNAGLVEGQKLISITFSAAGGNTAWDKSNPNCYHSLIFFQSVDNNDPTTFYGAELYNYDGASYYYYPVQAQVDVSSSVGQPTISFTLPRTHKAYTIPLNGMDSSLAAALQEGGSNGGGSASSGLSCLTQKADYWKNRKSDFQNTCLKSLGQAYFKNSSTVSFGGETYTGTKWDGTPDPDSQYMLYSLSNSPNPDRNSSSGAKKSQMGLQVDDNPPDGLNVNIDGDSPGEHSSIVNFDNTMNNIASGKYASVNLRFNNYDLNGNAYPDNPYTVAANLTNFNIVGTFYPGDGTSGNPPAVELNWITGGNNEQPYLGKYEKSASDPKTYSLTSGMSNCGSGNQAHFVFTTDPTTASTTYDGLLSARLLLPDSNCAFDGSGANVRIVVAPKGTVAPALPTSSTPPDVSSPGLDCHVSIFNPLSWFLCPLATALFSVVSGLDDAINNYLDIAPGQPSYSGTCASGDQWCGYYKAWSMIRNISLGLIAVFALFAIITQAMGLEILDAYTVRKVLPRLLVVGIGITLSWPLMMYFIGFTDAVGIGVRQLIYAPFDAAGFKTVELGGGAQVAAFFGAGTAIVALGFAGLLSFIATAALAAALAFLVLTLRQMLIVLLVIFAPIALACYVLPNTQRVWKLWVDSFAKGLMMFPIIAAFIAIGRVFAAVNSANTSGFQQILAFTAYFAPYFLIPFTFRLAGGALSTIGGLVNDRGRGAFDRLKKYRGAKISENAAAMRNYSRVGDKTAFGRGINTFLGAGAHPMDALRGRKGIRAGRYAGRTLQGSAELEADQTFQANKNDDNFLLAVANRSLAEQKLATARNKFASAKTDDERNKAQAEIDARTRGLDAAGRMNVNTRNRASTRQAALGALTRTGYQFGAGKQGYQELASTIQSISGGDTGAYTAMMDEAQYNLKGAGRFDLGGINHGAGYSYSTGVGKSSGYTLGNGKVQSFYAGAAENLGTGAVDENGETHKDVGQLTSAIQSSLASGETNIEKLGQWHSTLIDASMGGTVGNKAEAIKQLDAIEAINDPALKAILDQNRQRQRRGLSPDEIKSTET